ncbi:hypothetical protein [Variovorax sp. GB1P17]|uniref:hypothetical protein n=1 Tax=Variovorax sp. GB1P17 TaxID=3443740 RepID=UPI003F4589B5
MQALAAQLGCMVREFSPNSGHAQPALLGSTKGFSTALEEFGARFDDLEKVHIFRNWPTLEAALQHVIDERAKAGG